MGNIPLTRRRRRPQVCEPQVVLDTTRRFHTIIIRASSSWEMWLEWVAKVDDSLQPRIQCPFCKMWFDTNADHARMVEDEFRSHFEKEIQKCQVAVYADWTGTNRHRAPGHQSYDSQVHRM